MQAVPGSTQYEARSLAEQEKENLLTSEAVALFLDKAWPRYQPCTSTAGRLAQSHVPHVHQRIAVASMCNPVGAHQAARLTLPTGMRAQVVAVALYSTDKPHDLDAKAESHQLCKERLLHFLPQLGAACPDAAALPTLPVSCSPFDGQWQTTGEDAK